MAMISIYILIAAQSLLLEENLTGPISIYISDSNNLFYAILATFSFISSIVYIVLRANNSDFGLTAGQKDVASLVVSVGSTLGWLAIACIFIPMVILNRELIDEKNDLSRTNRVRTLVEMFTDQPFCLALVPYVCYELSFLGEDTYECQQDRT
jgi:hypothetical protein